MYDNHSSHKMQLSLPADSGRSYYVELKEKALDLLPEILEGLEIEVNGESAEEYYCDCPNHDSISGKSLHIKRDGIWHCFGCELGGDILQLVEFAQQGIVTKNETGTSMPNTHRAARDWLADFVGMPPLARSSTPDNDSPTGNETVFQCLSAVRDYGVACLQQTDNANILKWMKDTYAIPVDDYGRLGIGYIDSGRDLLAYLLANGFSASEILETGLFYKNEDTGGVGQCQMNERVIFPYFVNGQVRYLAGRATPQMVADGKAKYVKLRCASEADYISPHITNLIPFGVDCLRTRPQDVFVTEGITDALALQVRSFPVISPVTVRFSEQMWEILIKELRESGVRRAFICQDNEISKSGLRGAFSTARRLTQAGIKAFIITLPLEGKQQIARDAFQSEFGCIPSDAEVIYNLILDRKEALRNGIGVCADSSGGDPDRRKKLLSDAKLDLNEYFAIGHTADEFRELAANAPEFVELCLGAVYQYRKLAGSTGSCIEMIAKAVCFAPEGQQNSYYDRIKAIWGKEASPKREYNKACKDRLAEIQAAERRRAERGQEALKMMPAQNDFKAYVEAFKQGCRASRTSVEYDVLGEKCVEWLQSHDALFFEENDRQWLFYNGERYAITMNPAPKFGALIQRISGLTLATTHEKKFIQSLQFGCSNKGIKIRELTYRHTSHKENAVYFNMGNASTILEISPAGVRQVPNGRNENRIFLQPCHKFSPISYDETVNPVEVYAWLRENLLPAFTCSEALRPLLLLWISSFLLVDFTGTLAILRCEGGRGCGKTLAMKALSTLLYGQEEQKVATVAANYADASMSPALFLDNVENKNASDGLLDFLLVSASKIKKEKRVSGSDHEVTSENCHALVALNGIEPIGGHLTELQSRTIIARFNPPPQNSGFYETEYLQAIKDKRSWALSGVIKATAVTLNAIMSDSRKQAAQAILATGWLKDRERCLDHFVIMYLLYGALSGKSAQEDFFSAVDPVFNEMLKAICQDSCTDSSCSHPFVSFLDDLFHFYHRYDLVNDHRVGRLIRTSFVSINGELTEFDTIGSYFSDYCLLCREFGKEQYYKTPKQMSARINSEKDIIEQGGYKVLIEKDKHTKSNKYAFAKISNNQDAENDIHKSEVNSETFGFAI